MNVLKTTPHFALTFIVVGCATSLPKGTIDNRHFLYATRWNQAFVKCDLTSSLGLKFLDESNLYRWDVHFQFWKYPIDTLLKTKTYVEEREVGFLVPKIERVQITQLDYEVRNETLEFNMKVDSSFRGSIVLPSGKYIVHIRPGVGYVQSWIKDLEIKDGFCSELVAKLEKEEIPIY